MVSNEDFDKLVERTATLEKLVNNLIKWTHYDLIATNPASHNRKSEDRDRNQVRTKNVAEDGPILVCPNFDDDNATPVDNTDDQTKVDEVEIGDIVVVKVEEEEEYEQNMEQEVDNQSSNIGKDQVKDYGDDADSDFIPSADDELNFSTTAGKNCHAKRKSSQPSGRRQESKRGRRAFPCAKGLPANPGTGPSYGKKVVDTKIIPTTSTSATLNRKSSTNNAIPNPKVGLQLNPGGSGIPATVTHHPGGKSVIQDGNKTIVVFGGANLTPAQLQQIRAMDMKKPGVLTPTGVKQPIQIQKPSVQQGVVSTSGTHQIANIGGQNVIVKKIAKGGSSNNCPAKSSGGGDIPVTIVTAPGTPMPTAAQIQALLSSHKNLIRVDPKTGVMNISPATLQQLQQQQLLQQQQQQQRD